MKKSILIFILLICGNLAVAQQKEWENLLGLLQKEAACFEGKRGFIQLSKSEYNTFSIEKMSVTDSQIVTAFWMRDRFGNEGSERYLEETVLLEAGLAIASAEIFYNYTFYFSTFPDAQFLLIAFRKDFPLVHHIFSIYKDLKTKETAKSVMEDTTYQIVLPVRRRSRAKIFKAIDNYQRTTLMGELELDRIH